MITRDGCSPRKRDAIAALLAEQSIAEAARVAGISPQTLSRWLKDPAFDAAYREAKAAYSTQQRARLRQGLAIGARSLLKTMVDPQAKPATRFAAVRHVISLAQEARELEDLGAGLTEMEHAREAFDAAAVRLPAGERGRRRRAGHGARFPVRKEQAIAALLTQRTVAAAAGATGIARETLYQWMKEPEFDAAYREAAGSAFGPAMALLQQGLGAAVTLAKNFAHDMAVPEATRLKAAVYLVHQGIATTKEDMTARLAKVEHTAGSLPNYARDGTSPAGERTFHQRLARLKARLLTPPWAEQIGMEYIHSADGKATGKSVIGVAGVHVWLEPPAGCKEGEPVGERDELVPPPVAA